MADVACPSPDHTPPAGSPETDSPSRPHATAGIMRGMTIIVLPALFVAFAALCVWLTVRIINRRERWWTLVAVMSMPVLYVASFGPACWWFSNISMLPGGGIAAYRRVPESYLLMGWVARRGPRPLRDIINWYATLGLGDETLECETLAGEEYGFIHFWK